MCGKLNFIRAKQHYIKNIYRKLISTYNKKLKNLQRGHLLGYSGEIDSDELIQN